MHRLMTAVAALALMAAPACDQGAAKKDAPQGQAKGPTEAEVGEKWNFGNLLDRINQGFAKQSPAREFMKIPSQKHPDSMHFITIDPKEYDNSGGQDFLMDNYAPASWKGPGWAGVRVTDAGTARKAREDVANARDRLNEVDVVSWGKYVLRGPQPLLKEVHALLPR